MLTKKYKRLWLLFSFLSFALTIGPLGYYISKAFIEGDTKEKLCLGLLGTASIILVCINVLCKKRIRSVLWLLVLGIYIVLENLVPLLLFIAIGTILDEFIFEPLAKKFKTDYICQRNIDKRLP